MKRDAEARRLRDLARHYWQCELSVTDCEVCQRAIVYCSNEQLDEAFDRAQPQPPSVSHHPAAGPE